MKTENGFGARLQRLSNSGDGILGLRSSDSLQPRLSYGGPSALVGGEKRVFSMISSMNWFFCEIARSKCSNAQGSGTPPGCWRYRSAVRRYRFARPPTTIWQPFGLTATGTLQRREGLINPSANPFLCGVIMRRLWRGGRPPVVPVRAGDGSCPVIVARQ